MKLISGILNAPCGYMSVDIFKQGPDLEDQWPRFYNGHPIIDGELAGNCPIHVIVPPDWIKEVNKRKEND